MSETKVCEGCGKTFSRTTKGRLQRWINRRYCTPTCGVKDLGGKPKTGRICLACRKPLVQHSNENPSAFNRRKFCSRDCGHKTAARRHNAQNKHAIRSRSGPLPPVTQSEAERLISEWLKKHKPTRGEPKFCAASQQALIAEAEIAKRLKRVKREEERTRAQTIAAFKTGVWT
jgi:hypothetical protein